MNQDHEEDLEIKKEFDQLREKWDRIKDTFNPQDRGKPVVLMGTGEVLIFPDMASATKYRIDHGQHVASIVRHIGGEPVCIGPICIGPICIGPAQLDEVPTNVVETGENHTSSQSEQEFLESRHREHNDLIRQRGVQPIASFFSPEVFARLKDSLGTDEQLLDYWEKTEGFRPLLQPEYKK